MTVGFDFGTTNSLIAMVAGDRVINVLDDDGLPVPSVVRYEGEHTIVGRDAKEALDTAGLGVHGDTVRSPKFLLGEESVHVGGVERSPIDIVHDVVRFVRLQALASRQRAVLGEIDNAVVSIPVTMNGPRRAALRDAFRLADIGIVQFVHEPFAALYGYVRGSEDPADTKRALNRRNVLVVDWGGGTLDLTLCRIEGNSVVQLRNGGSAEIGGDRFDDAIRDEVIRRAMAQENMPAEFEPHPDARLRLLHTCELNKIELSTRETVTFYRPGFFGEKPLNFRMSRTELDEITRPLVTAGLREITALLDSVNIGPSQVALCLVVGGMASMPAIRGRLHELFGPQRVVVPANSATLVAEGAAWIAHDSRRLHLAKPIEVQLARGSYLTLVRAGTEMPSEHQIKQQTVHLFCTDPTDGVAKFQLCTPTRQSPQPQSSEPRTSIGNIIVQVDSGAQPFKERLELSVSIDDDLILYARATSSDVKDVGEAEYHDLEFGITLPRELGDGGHDDSPDIDDDEQHESGTLSVRANISAERDNALIPGEVLYRFDRRAFDPRFGRATRDQVREHLYYQPCAVCKRASSDPLCRCSTHPPR